MAGGKNARTRKGKAAPRLKNKIDVPSSEKYDHDSIRREKELQKETSNYIQKWLSPRKNRTITLLARKTQLAASSLREYLKGKTQVSAHRALPIVAVCNPEDLIDYIEKFLPEIFPPIQKSIEARARKLYEDSDVIKHIIKTIFTEAEISKAPFILEAARVLRSVLDKGLVAGSGNNIFVMGGVSAGIVLKVGNSTFDRIAKTLLDGESIKIEQESYRLKAFDPDYRVLTLEKIESRGWVFLCADQCKLFDGNTKMP